jgi:hypothetical protein
MAVGDITLIKWEKADFKWNKAPTNLDGIIPGIVPSRPIYTWSDVALVEKALGGGGDMEEMPWTKWDDTDERKKSLIKLICKVQGKTIIKEKYIQNYKITASDIKILAEKVLGIEVITENIKF